MNRRARTSTVILGLAVVGAVAGALAGVLPLLVFLAAIDALDRHAIGHAINIGGGTGAVLGVVLGPWVAWSSLRSVALGRAIGHSFLGTLAGGAAGLLLASLFDAMFLMPLIGAVGGFFCAVARLANGPTPPHTVAPSDAV
jgi:hypothetical protein